MRKNYIIEDDDDALSVEEALRRRGSGDGGAEEQVEIEEEEQEEEEEEEDTENDVVVVAETAEEDSNDSTVAAVEMMTQQRVSDVPAVASESSLHSSNSKKKKALSHLSLTLQSSVTLAGAWPLIHWVECCPTLKTFGVCRIGRPDTTDVTDSLLHAAAHNKSIAKVYIGTYHYDAAALSYLLRTSTSLRKLKLDGFPIFDESNGDGGQITDLQNAFRSCDSLECLDLEATSLSDAEYIPAILQQSFANHTRLKSLILPRMNTAAYATAVMHVLQSSTPLSHLCLCWSDLVREETAVPIRDGLLFHDGTVQKNSTLQSLSLKQCTLTIDSARVLASVIATNAVPTLKRVELCSTLLEEGVLMYIATAFSTNTTVRTLHLTGEYFNASRATHVANMLRENATLQTVCLGRCDPAAWAVLCMTLWEKNHTLQTLMVRDLVLLGGTNTFEDSCRRIFRQALPGMEGLRCLSMEWTCRPNYFPLSNNPDLLSGFRNNYLLTEIDMRGCDHDVAGLQLLAQYSLRNRLFQLLRSLVHQEGEPTTTLVVVPREQQQQQPKSSHQDQQQQQQQQREEEPLVLLLPAVLKRCLQFHEDGIGATRVFEALRLRVDLLLSGGR